MQHLFKPAACLLALSFVSACAFADGHSAAADTAAEKTGTGAWVSLIPGEDLAGWSTRDKNKHAYWAVKDGVIVGANPDKKESRLWTDAEHGDFELIVEYQALSEEYDSGVYLHGSSHQVQIGISRSQHVDLTGAIYCPKDGNGKYPQMPPEVQQKVEQSHRLGEWNTLRIVTRGRHIKTFLNGEVINDYQAVKYEPKGKIGLQLHSNVDMKIAFRTVKLRGLGAPGR